MIAQIRPPDEIFNGDDLPDDLKWIMTHFGLPKNDPTVVLLAWHWYRVLNNQDAIHAGAMELKTVLDPRLEKINAFAERLEQIHSGLEHIAVFLTQTELKNHIQTGLHQPIQEVGLELKKILPELRKNWTQLFWPWCGAFYLGGLTSGTFFTLCVLYLLSSH